MKNKKEKYLYCLVTNDKWEYVVRSCRTLRELASEIGLSYDLLAKCFERGSVLFGKYKIVKVDCRYDSVEEDFTYSNYKKFCKEKGIKPGRALSLKSFYNTCSGRGC